VAHQWLDPAAVSRANGESGGDRGRTVVRIEEERPRQVMPGRQHGGAIEISEGRCVEHDHAADGVRLEELGRSVGLLFEETEEAQSSRMASLGGCLPCTHRQIATEQDVCVGFGR
jgi:hypothetical protein